MSVALRKGQPQLFQVFNYPVESIFSSRKRYCYSCAIQRSCVTKCIKTPGGGGYSGKFFLGMCRWPLRAPTPLQSTLWTIIDPILVTFGQMCNFRDPRLSHFLFLRIDPFFRLNEEHFTFHLQYKHSGTFANRKYGELSYPQKIRKCVTPLQSIQS